MRNGYPETDAGTPTCFPLVDRTEQRCVITSPTIRQVTGELGDDAALIPSHHRHEHLVRREQLGQEHGFGWDSMGSNLYRATE